jgi:hypothetical protein
MVDTPAITTPAPAVTPSSPSAPPAAAPAPAARPGRQPHWSDATSDEGRYIARQEGRRAEAETAPSTPAPPPLIAPTAGASDTPAERFKFGDDLELSADEIKGLMERHALETSRKLTLPADPSGYKLELPKDFVPPQGVEFKFDEKDPAVKLARDFAHANGFTQEQFSRMAAVYAAGKVQEQAGINAAIAAERDKLGAAASSRVTAIQQYLRGHLGDELAQALMVNLLSAAQVQAFEKLMNRDRGSEGRFSHAHREPPPDTGTIPGYANMSFEQRRAAQDAIQQRRR